MHAYTTPGEKTVRLGVNDGNGGLDDVTHVVTVKDPSAAAASFDFTPISPRAGQVVTFTSTSTPSAGQTISSQKWDLDSDGAYDDATGATATQRFDNPGVYRVALQVTQANGNDTVAEGTVRVGTIEQTPPGAPSGPPTARTKAKPSLMNPFPFIRLRAAAYRSYTRVQILSVRGPRGSVVKVRCKGKGCPKATRRKRPRATACGSRRSNATFAWASRHPDLCRREGPDRQVRELQDAPLQVGRCASTAASCRAREAAALPVLSFYLHLPRK